LMPSVETGRDMAIRNKKKSKEHKKYLTFQRKEAVDPRRIGDTSTNAENFAIKAFFVKQELKTDGGHLNRLGGGGGPKEKRTRGGGDALSNRSG